MGHIIQNPPLSHYSHCFFQHSSRQDYIQLVQHCADKTVAMGISTQEVDSNFEKVTHKCNEVPYLQEKNQILPYNPMDNKYYSQLFSQSY